MPTAIVMTSAPVRFGAIGHLIAVDGAMPAVAPSTCPAGAAIDHVHTVRLQKPRERDAVLDRPSCSSTADTRKTSAVLFGPHLAHLACNLLHQFLSEFANKRTDEYGGSFENRTRFAVEVAREVRKVWPESKPLFFRVSAVDETGWTIEDSIALARLLKANGVDVIDCSSGGMSDGATASEMAPSYGYQVPYARAIRTGADVMTMAVGMIVHSDHAEQIVQDGSADLVAIGREMLHNPHWPMDAAQKLGVDAPFSGIPNAYSYFLDKRVKIGFRTPSTFQTGMKVE